MALPAEETISAVAASIRPRDTWLLLVAGLLAVVSSALALAAPRLLSHIPAHPAVTLRLSGPTTADRAVAATEPAPAIQRFFIPSAGRGGNAIRVAQEVRDRQQRLLQVAFPERNPDAPTDPRREVPTVPAFAAPEPYRTPAPPRISQSAATRAARQVAQQHVSLAVRASLRDRDRLLAPWPVADLVGLASRPGAPPRAGPFAATF